MGDYKNANSGGAVIKTPIPGGTFLRWAIMKNANPGGAVIKLLFQEAPFSGGLL